MHTPLKLCMGRFGRVTLVLPHSDKGAGFSIDRVDLPPTGESHRFSDIFTGSGSGPGQDLHDLDNAFQVEDAQQRRR